MQLYSNIVVERKQYQQLIDHQMPSNMVDSIASYGRFDFGQSQCYDQGKPRKILVTDINHQKEMILIVLSSQQH